MCTFGKFAAAAVAALVAGCATQTPVVPQSAAEPGMMLVGGGPFTMGRDKGELNERPSHKVHVDTFALDRTEVSAGDFAEFLNAAGNPDDVYFTPDEYATVVAVPAGDGLHEIRFSARAGYERFPANNVSWKGADAYCRWRGKSLPTEAEWEKAARGNDKRRFPWGKRNPTDEVAQYDRIWQEKQFAVLVPVDALPAGASPYGLLNMSGNVLEWVKDWYRQNLCDFCNPEGETNVDLILRLAGRAGEAGEVSVTPHENTRQKRQVPPRNNPKGPTTGSFKVLRGGSWQDCLEGDLMTTRRYWLDPSQRFPHTGFRCSKEASPDKASPDH